MTKLNGVDLVLIEAMFEPDFTVIGRNWLYTLLSLRLLHFKTSEDVQYVSLEELSKFGVIWRS